MKNKSEIIKIGITGGVGSGKSYFLKQFANLGIPTYQADAQTKALYHKDTELQNWLINNFGREVYDEQMVLNKSYLAGVIFNNPDKLEMMNNYVHPKTINDFLHWSKNQSFDSPFFAQNKVKFVVKEAALIFEANAEKDLDYILYVYAPMEIRIARVISRDNLTRNEIIARIQKQLPDSYKMARSNYIIRNYLSSRFKNETFEEILYRIISEIRSK